MSANHNPDNPEHVSRREAMRRGVLGAAGIVAAGGLSSRVFAAPAKKTPQQNAAAVKAARDAAAIAKAKAKKVKAKSVIQIFLWGGMSHNDTWDPKPEQGRDYMGEFMDVDVLEEGSIHHRPSEHGKRLGLESVLESIDDGDAVPVERVRPERFFKDVDHLAGLIESGRWVSDEV